MSSSTGSDVTDLFGTAWSLPFSPWTKLSMKSTAPKNFEMAFITHTGRTLEKKHKIGLPKIVRSEDDAKNHRRTPTVD